MRDDGGDAGRDRDRHGEDVVDEQRRAGHQRRVLAEVLPADDVGAAAARVGEDRLAVRRPRRSPAGRPRRSAIGTSLDRAQGQARRADGDDEEDLLGGVGGGGDGVGGERRQRDRLRQPLVLLLGRGQGPAEQDALQDRIDRLGIRRPAVPRQAGRTGRGPARQVNSYDGISAAAGLSALLAGGVDSKRYPMPGSVMKYRGSRRIGLELAADVGEVHPQVVGLLAVRRPPHLLRGAAGRDELAGVADERPRRGATRSV